MKLNEIIDKYAQNKEEAKWIERIVSMMMCIKKYENLKRLSNK